MDRKTGVRQMPYWLAGFIFIVALFWLDRFLQDSERAYSTTTFQLNYWLLNVHALTLLAVGFLLGTVPLFSRWAEESKGRKLRFRWPHFAFGFLAGLAALLISPAGGEGSFIYYFVHSGYPFSFAYSHLMQNRLLFIIWGASVGWALEWGSAKASKTEEASSAFKS